MNFLAWRIVIILGWCLAISCGFKNEKPEIADCLDLSHRDHFSYDEVLKQIDLNHDMLLANSAYGFCMIVEGKGVHFSSFIFKSDWRDAAVGESPLPCDCNWIRLNGSKVMVDTAVNSIQSLDWSKLNPEVGCLCLEVRDQQENYLALLLSLENFLADTNAEANVYFIRHAQTTLKPAFNTE